MNGRQSAWRSPDQWVYSVVAIGMFFALLTLLFRLRSPREVELPDIGPWLAAGLFYALAHLVRIARLAILAGDPGVSLRHIGSVHFATSAASLVLPFKLGEVFRIAELGHLLGGAGRALIIVWMERAFDFAVLVPMIVLVAGTSPDGLAQIGPLLALATIFVVSTLLVFALLPEGLSTLAWFVLRRYDGEGAIRILKWIKWLREAIGRGPQMVAGKIAPLGVITIGIWLLELAAFWFLIPETRSPFMGTIRGLVVQLSDGSMQGVFSLGATRDWPYAWVAASVLLPLGILCALSYAPSRLGRSLTRPSTASGSH